MLHFTTCILLLTLLCICRGHSVWGGIRSGCGWIQGQNVRSWKSNHFYCHITTAQVPWWVKFLWACSRQRKKNNNNNLHMDRQCKKNNKQFTYGQTVQKKQQTIYIWTDSAKNNNKQFTYGQTVQKKTTNNLHMDRQCKKIYTYIYSVHIVYYKDTLNYQRHIIHCMGTSTLCTVSIHNVVYT